MMGLYSIYILCRANKVVIRADGGAKIGMGHLAGHLLSLEHWPPVAIPK
jgi:hypothetical protein